jgi:hypothetical protein
MKAARLNGVVDIPTLDGLLGGKQNAVGSRINGPAVGRFGFYDEEGVECTVSLQEIMHPQGSLGANYVASLPPLPRANQVAALLLPRGGLGTNHSQERLEVPHGGITEQNLDEFISRMAGQAEPAMPTTALKDKRDFTP